MPVIMRTIMPVIACMITQLKYTLNQSILRWYHRLFFVFINQEVLPLVGYIIAAIHSSQHQRLGPPPLPSFSSITLTL